MRLDGIALLLIGFVGLGLGASLNRPDIPTPTCGYESCTKSDPNKLNIHLVAHTHDDVGWLKTVDQYYFGARMNIQLAGVQYIIDSVVDALEKDPARKFIYVETAFLWKWWLRQDDNRRELVRKFINEGRLEIIGGGWSMNDEAVTHYHSMIDQYTWGFRRLNDTFGYCARPKIGWQIDPFGHSREQASMFAQLGFDGMLFGRLDYQDKNQRLKDKTGEFIWQGSPNLGKSAELFTTMLYNAYSPPPGFCFDILCQDAEPMIDDVNSADYNIDQRVEQFLEYVNNQSKYYRTNNVILTMGGDFTYQYADMYFKNLDKVIRYVNERNGSNYNAFYSTPSCYLKSLNEQNLKWSVKTDDFFPYASDPHSFWTGYYSSRPTIKYFERLGNNFLQVVKQLTVLSNEPDSEKLQLFREAMGVMQHHDAVTGTEKQHVAEDYARILHHSFKNGEDLAAAALNKLTMKKQPREPAEFNTCLLLNISACEHTTDNKKFVVTVYNPTSQPLTTFVNLPIQSANYSVRDYTGKEIVTQRVPIHKRVLNIPGRVSKATEDLVFKATDIAPFGYQSFYVSQTSVEKNDLSVVKQVEYATIESYNISVTQDGALKFQSLAEDNIDIRMEYYYYEGVEGNNKVFENRSSGAYIFRPKDNFAKNLGKLKDFQAVKGPLVTEVHASVNDWVSVVVRFYKGTTYYTINWLVGPIPVNDDIGKEIIIRYVSNLKNNGEFYTDSNGREMLKRKLNYRPTWNLELKEPVSGNYYPVTSKLVIENGTDGSRMAVLTDRAQGGTSLEDGVIELMLHRRLLVDDAFGVGEALNESAYGAGLVVRGQHILLPTQSKNLEEGILAEKELAFQLALKPWIFITPLLDSFDEYNEYYNMKGEGLINSNYNLPKNVHILTLEPWKDGEVLLRLEHIFEKGESSIYSTPAQVNLKEVFSLFTVQSVRETILGANQWANDNERLNWQSETNELPNEEDTSADSTKKISDSFVVTLNPMEIRTFIVKLSPAVKSTA